MSVERKAERKNMVDVVIAVVLRFALVDAYFIAGL
jgi:hypothetical protein